MIALIQCSAPPRIVDVQGHRGARAVHPENSLPGFLYAAEIGVSTLELDVVVTAAGEVVISHEPWFNPEICRMGENGHVSLYPMALAAIQACDCGSWGHPRFPNQHPAPTFKPTLDQLVSALQEAGHTGVGFNIEIKHEAAWVGLHAPEAEVAAAAVLGAIRRCGIAPWTTVQSFSADVLERVHAADAGVQTAWLMEDEKSVLEALACLTFRPDVYSPHHVLLSPEEVQRAQALGVRVVPWTVNDRARMQELLDWGVDGLISDDPALALEVVGQIPHALTSADPAS